MPVAMLQIFIYIIDIVVKLRNTPQVRQPDEMVRVNMAVEFGKADIDSAEYRYDIVIQEIESGFFLGPVLRYADIK